MTTKFLDKLLDNKNEFIQAFNKNTNPNDIDSELDLDLDENEFLMFQE